MANVAPRFANLEGHRKKKKVSSTIIPDYGMHVEPVPSDIYTHILQLYPRMQSQFFIRICKHKRLISDIIDAETYDAHSIKIACFCDDRVES